MEEKIARDCYQFAHLIDDKDIDHLWHNVLLPLQKERFYQCARQILASLAGGEMGNTEIDEEMLGVPESDTAIHNWISGDSRLKIIAHAQAIRIRAQCEKEFELRYNPDYLDFKKGVKEGRELERAQCELEKEKIFEEIRKYKKITSHNIFPPHEGYVLNEEELEYLESKHLGGGENG